MKYIKNIICVCVFIYSGRFKVPKLLNSELSLNFILALVAFRFLCHYFVLLYHYLMLRLGTHLLGIFSESVSSSSLGLLFISAPWRVVFFFFFFRAHDPLLATDCCWW